MNGGHTLKVAGLFAGIGGIDLGLERAGHHVELLCENDPAAKAVLAKRFPGVPLVDDVRSIRSLPNVDLVAAGFPCQDLSQAGRTNGIYGRRSGIVRRALQLIEARPLSKRPSWILIENVPFMLQLGRGRAMKFLTKYLGNLGYMWAYRVVDTQAFGLPQRRRRVILLGSKTGDPRAVLLAEDKKHPEQPSEDGQACGFYWTEGNRGLGWAVNAIPPLKGSSGLGIPSPPGIWMPDGRVVVPDIRDAECLQGFHANWTAPALDETGRGGTRWRLVGNAVSVPVSQWVGERLRTPKTYDSMEEEVVLNGDRWPSAAWGRDGKAFRANVSAWPVRRKSKSLSTFLRYPTLPLSARAAGGFLARLRGSRLRVSATFLRDLARHVDRVKRTSSR